MGDEKQGERAEQQQSSGVAAEVAAAAKQTPEKICLPCRLALFLLLSLLLCCFC